MRHMLAIGALALATATSAVAIAAPSFAAGYPQTLSSDAEIRDQQLWDRTVDRANDYRHGTTASEEAVKQASVSNSGSATDAVIGRGAAPQAAANFGPAGYGAGVSCPGTNEAGGNWHAGEYCLPGGR